MALEAGPSQAIGVDRRVASGLDLRDGLASGLVDLRDVRVVDLLVGLVDGLVDGRVAVWDLAVLVVVDRAVVAVVDRAVVAAVARVVVAVVAAAVVPAVAAVVAAAVAAVVAPAVAAVLDVRKSPAVVQSSEEPGVCRAFRFLYISAS